MIPPCLNAQMFAAALRRLPTSSGSALSGVPGHVFATASLQARLRSAAPPVAVFMHAESSTAQTILSSSADADADCAHHEVSDGSRSAVSAVSGQSHQSRGAFRGSRPTLGRKRVHPGRAEKAARREATAAASSAAVEAAAASLRRRAAFVTAQVTAVQRLQQQQQLQQQSSAASGAAAAQLAETAAVVALPRALAGHVQRPGALVVRVLRLGFPGRGVAMAVPQAELDALAPLPSQNQKNSGNAQQLQQKQQQHSSVASAVTEAEAKQRYLAATSGSQTQQQQAQVQSMPAGPAPAPGKSIFVPLTCPGDVALVTVTRDAASFAEAALLTVLAHPVTPVVVSKNTAADSNSRQTQNAATVAVANAQSPCSSPTATARVPASASPALITRSSAAPVCGSFGRCGGCAYMHLPYSAQLAAKRAQLVDTLERLGRFRAPQLSAHANSNSNNSATVPASAAVDVFSSSGGCGATVPLARLLDPAHKAALDAIDAADAADAKAAADRAKSVRSTDGAEDLDLIGVEPVRTRGSNAAGSAAAAAGAAGPAGRSRPRLPPLLPLAAVRGYPGSVSHPTTTATATETAGDTAESQKPETIATLVRPTLPSPHQLGFRPRARLHALTVAVDHAHAARYSALQSALQTAPAAVRAALPLLPPLAAVLADCGADEATAHALATGFDHGTSWLLTVGHYGHSNASTFAADVITSNGSALEGLRVLPGGGVLVSPVRSDGAAGCAVLSAGLNAALALLPTRAALADRPALALAVAAAAARAERELGVRLALTSALTGNGAAGPANAPRNGGNSKAPGARGRDKAANGNSNKRGRGNDRDRDEDGEARDPGAVSDADELWDQPTVASNNSNSNSNSNSASAGAAPGGQQSKGRPLTVLLSVGAALAALVMRPETLASCDLAAAVDTRRAVSAHNAQHGHHGAGRGPLHAHRGAHVPGEAEKRYVSRYDSRHSDSRGDGFNGRGGGRGGSGGGAPSSYDPRSHRGTVQSGDGVTASASLSPQHAAAEALAEAQAAAGEAADALAWHHALPPTLTAALRAATDLVCATVLATAGPGGADAYGAADTLARALAPALARAAASPAAMTALAAALARGDIPAAAAANNDNSGDPCVRVLLRRPLKLHSGAYVRRAQLSLAEVSTFTTRTTTSIAAGDGNATSGTALGDRFSATSGGVSSGGQRVGHWHAPLDAFFQTNVSALPPLVAAVRARVRDAAESEAAVGDAFGPPSKGLPRHVLDLHCGVGLFSLGLALPQRVLEASLLPPQQHQHNSRKPFAVGEDDDDWCVSTYLGVEVNPLAIEAAAANAETLQMLREDIAYEDACAAADNDNGEPGPEHGRESDAEALGPLETRGVFIADAADAVLSRLCAPSLRIDSDSVNTNDAAAENNAETASARLQWRPRLTTAVVDPPRAGLDPATVAALRKAGPQQIVYVSCDPTTLARDLALLCDPAGGEAVAVVNAALGRGASGSGQSAEGAEKAVMGLPNAVYELVYAQPADMFPNSGSIETVVDLRRVA